MTRAHPTKSHPPKAAGGGGATAADGLAATRQYTTPDAGRQPDAFADLLIHLHRGGSWAYWWTNPGRLSHWWHTATPTPPPGGEHDVYFGVHPATQRRGNHQRTRADDVAAVSCLFADLDAKAFEGGKAAALAHVDSLSPAPSVVIDSGGGYHAYWLLSEPYLLTTATKRERAGSVQGRWVALVGGDTGAKDLARILRVPGTRNLKYPDRPLVTVIRADFEQLYDLDALESLLPATPPPAPVSPPDSRRATRWARAALENELAALGAATEGHRNTQLNRSSLALGQIVGAGLLNRGDVEQALHTAGINTGLTEREVLATVKSGLDAGEREPRGPAETRAPPATHHKRIPQEAGTREPEPLPQWMQAMAHRTDAGNADRLVAEHGDELRYCHPWSTWLAWDGRRWAIDDDAEVTLRAKLTARSIYQEAARSYERANVARNDDDEKRHCAEGAAWAKHATASLSQYRIRAMLQSAEAELPVSPDALDADPWLLNVANGILDLRTGELRPHDRAAYITKLAPVVYDPDATLQLWDDFLAEATGGDVALMLWLQKAVGYTLTGSTAEERLFFVHGPAATGKSTFLEAIRATMGDYARTADFETFLQRRHVGGPRPDIARLAGARFVPSIEVECGKRLAEGLVKVLTGGDTVTARELYAREFEYRPAFKLWLAANDAPAMEASDEALWRRILRVPFDAVIPKDRRDPAVKATLGDPDIAGAAILAWAVRGCLAWQRDGLGECPAVTRATADLRADMDRLRDFLAECCVLNANAWAATADLRGAYETWCKENGEKELSGRAWRERLRANGCTPSRDYVGGKRARGWGGVGLLTSEE